MTGITVDQTSTGWKIVASDVEKITVETDGPRLSFSIEPDSDIEGTPLEVTLDQ